MKKDRLEASSDGMIAILMTGMALGLKVPKGKLSIALIAAAVALAFVAS